MVVRLQCPSCNTSCEVDGRHAGQYGECPTCGARVRIPRPGQDGPTSAFPPATGGSRAGSVVQLLLAVVTGAAAVAALLWCFEHFPAGSQATVRQEAGGKLHPLLVHLPIGFVLAAALLEVFTGRWRRHSSAVTGLLWLSLFSGIAAVFAGYFTGLGGEHNPETLRYHFWSGLAVPSLALCSLIAKLIHNLKPSMATGIYRIPLLGATTAVFLAGFFGGKLTHGGDTPQTLLTLLTGQTPESEAAPAGPLEERTVYDAAIAPILTAKCTSCHGEEKKKGQLQLHNHESLLLAGDSENPAVVPGDSAGSEVVVRILLPEDSDDHMPPEGKPQLTEAEIEILRWWIDSGAKSDVTVRDAGVPEALLPKLAEIASAPPPASTPEPEPVPVVAVSATPEQQAAIETIEKDLGVAILPVSQSDAALTFNAVNVAGTFGDAELARFAPLAGLLTELNLSRSKISDAGVAAISGMENLKKLHLENTSVTDAAIDAILPLANLEYLNLFNTAVTDAGIAKLAALKSLKRLYVWQTGVTEAGATALHQALPDIVINLGWDKEIKTAQAPPPPAPPEPEPAAAVAAVTAPADPEQPVYDALVAPVLAEKCSSCHGEEKQKGGLAVHSLAELLKGGDSGEAVVAGKSGDSLFIQRIALPLDSDDHMPPEGKPQLTEAEIELLKWWVDDGAKPDVKIKDAALPDSLK